MRLWLKFCVVWAVFSLVWGPLIGPDNTWWDRVWFAVSPLVIGAMLTPIFRMFNFRLAYRIGGRDGVYGLIGAWVFFLTVFLGPAISHELGFQRVSDALIWVLAFFCGILPAFLFCFWVFVKLPFMVLRWLARLLFPQLFGADSRCTRSPEP